MHLCLSCNPRDKSNSKTLPHNNNRSLKGEKSENMLFIKTQQVDLSASSKPS